MLMIHRALQQRSSLFNTLQPDCESIMSSQHTVSNQYYTHTLAMVELLNCWLIVIYTDDCLSATSSLKSTHFWTGHL